MAHSSVINVSHEPFPCFYENCFKLLLAYPHIKTITTDNKLMGSTRRDYIDYYFKNWKTHHLILDSKCTKIRQKQLKGIQSEVDEYFYITKSKKTDLLSFIHHLRNAIAHGETNVDNSFIEIKDYFYNKYENKIMLTPSAMCKISNANLQLFMSELVKVL